MTQKSFPNYVNARTEKQEQSQEYQQLIRYLSPTVLGQQLAPALDRSAHIRELRLRLAQALRRSDQSRQRGLALPHLAIHVLDQRGEAFGQVRTLTGQTSARPAGMHLTLTQVRIGFRMLLLKQLLPFAFFDRLHHGQGRPTQILKIIARFGSISIDGGHEAGPILIVDIAFLGLARLTDQLLEFGHFIVELRQSFADRVRITIQFDQRRLVAMIRQLRDLGFDIGVQLGQVVLKSADLLIGGVDDFQF